jgi:hypothetical protein
MRVATFIPTQHTLTAAAGPPKLPRVRTTLILSIFLASAAAASAEPVRTVCYTGSQTAKVGTLEQKTLAVVERTYDPAKNEIRQRTWSDKNPTKEVGMTGKVDPKAGTLEFEDPDLGAKGTGKLEGKPWHWTSMTMTLTKGDLVVASTSTLTDTKLQQQATMTNKGKAIGTVTGDLTVFDCKQLEDKKAALGKPAATK